MTVMTNIMLTTAESITKNSPVYMGVAGAVLIDEIDLGVIIIARDMRDLRRYYAHVERTEQFDPKKIKPVAMLQQKDIKVVDGDL